MTGAAAHDLNDRAALVRLHGVAQLIDTLDSGVARGIEADGVVGAHDVVVDGARHADARNALARKRLCAAERTVAAAADEAVDAQILAGVGRLLETLLGHHFLAACGVQHGAALADDAVNAARAHLDDVTVDQAAVAAADAEDGNIICRRASNDRTDECVHARCVAAACKYANSSNLLFHRESLLQCAVRAACVFSCCGCPFPSLHFLRYAACRTALSQTYTYFIITSSSLKRKRNFCKIFSSGSHHRRRESSVFFFVSSG